LKKNQLLVLLFILLGAVLVRAFSVAEQPFFCDVPFSLRAIDSGRMTIQFPGYVPFHLLIKLFTFVVGPPFVSFIFFSLVCGIGSLLYSTFFGYDRAGFRGGVLMATLMGFSPLAIYFSCVGASYTTELFSMSAMIFHGNRVLAKDSEFDYRCAVLWFVFGSLMRTLSFTFVGLGVIYLLFRLPSRQRILFTAGAFTAGAAIYLSVTFYYFHGLKGVIDSFRIVNEALHHYSLSWLLGNWVRLLIFIGWGLNVLIVVIPVTLWLSRKRIDRPLAIFFLLLSVPYFLVLVRYIPHAGYICLLLPVLLGAPLLVKKEPWTGLRAVGLCLLFLVVSLVQFFGAKPIPFRGTTSLVLNSYVLFYTYRGIQIGMFDNLTDFAKKYHIHVHDSQTK
jgi:hypothetical protein